MCQVVQYLQLYIVPRARETNSLQNTAYVEMASSRTPVVRVISLFSKEASNLLSRSCVQASLCPWTSGGLEPDAGDPGQEKGGAMEVRVAGGAKEDPRCLACQTSFSSRQEQVDHYRLDWHRYNIKRRLKGLENVDQAHFERLAGMAVRGWV